ncbi:MAG: ATP-binding protein [Candidatus Omnitrophota bacterium]|nr:ATP-binding protein [Candidatus Omnitrophota bacterium]
MNALPNFRIKTSYLSKNAMQKDKIRDFLGLTLTNCMNLLESRSGSIFLFDEKKQELILKTARNSRKKSLLGIRQKLGENVSGLVASERKPFLVKDSRTDPRLQNRQRFNHYPTNSFLSLPLISYGKLIGVININEKSSGEVFSLKDLKLLSFISDYIAIAIYKTQLYEETRNSHRKLDEKIKAGDKEQDKLKKFASIGKLLAGMAHELNNPLDGTIRYVNLSLATLKEDEISREYLLNAKKGLNRMAGIIRSLLDFAQSSSPVFNGLIDINKAIENSLLMMNHYILPNNIKVVRQFNPHLPPVRDNGLKLVFTNIIKNTCDAMPGGGIIKVSTEMRNGHININFTDTGPGVPEEIRDKIFEPFFTTKEMGKGSGLGLAICYDIVQRHNGRIFLEDSKEKGASFTIQLSANGINHEGG